jgi:transcriptional regulator with XRE-family HTH domain
LRQPTRSYYTRAARVKEGWLLNPTQTVAFPARTAESLPLAQMRLGSAILDPDELGRRIRAARAYARLTTQELAKRVDIGRSTLERIESGHQLPKRWQLWGIAEVTGLPRNWFTADWTDRGGLSGIADAATEIDALAEPGSETDEGAAGEAGS